MIGSRSTVVSCRAGSGAYPETFPVRSEASASRKWALEMKYRFDFGAGVTPQTPTTPLGVGLYCFPGA